MPTKNVLLTGMSNAGKKSILQCSKDITNMKCKNLKIISFDIDNKHRLYWSSTTLYFDGLIYVIDTKDRVNLGNINIYILFSGWIRNEFIEITKREIPNDVIDIIYNYFNAALMPIIGTVDTAFDKLESLDCGETVCSAKLRYDAPILVYANKCDLVNGMSQNEIIKKLNLKSFERKWNVQLCSAKTEYGLQTGLNWFVKTINDL